MKSLDLFSIGSWTIFDHIFKMSRYPEQGETITLDMPSEQLDHIYYGDCSANVAAVASSLGLRVGLGMVVGDDFITSGYKSHLQQLGVELSGVQIIKGQRSGHSYLYFDKNGDGFCLSHLGIAEDQSDWDIPTSAIESARAVVINEKFSAYTLAAIRRAKASGAIAAINGMIGTAGTGTKAFLESADILFIAQSELSNLLALLGCNRVDDLHRFGPQRIYVTLGAKGSRVYVEGASYDVEIVSTDNVVDATGAGDAYTGGTMVALLKGYSDVEAARIGAAVSSFVVEEWGCQENLPDWNTVLGRLQDI